MPRKKKKASEMTTDELAKRVFPPEVIEEIRRVAEKEPKKPRKTSSQQDDSKE